MPTDWKSTRGQLLNGSEKRVFIASHRGKFGMTVMENTALAFQLAVLEGADMVEMDLARTKDGVLVGFHDDSLLRMTGQRGRIQDKSYAELMELELYTYMYEKNGAYLETFEEMIAPLKDKTILVLDKCWDYWDEVYQVLKGLDMAEQAIFKFYSSDRHLYGEVGKYPEPMFVPMHAAKDELEDVLALRESCCLMGLEILPEDKTDPVLSAAYIESLHQKGLKVWCNSLSFCKELIFGGGYDDLLSLSRGGDAGWGELLKRGVDIIQTDWPYELKLYLSQGLNAETD